MAVRGVRRRHPALRCGRRAARRLHVGETMNTVFFGLFFNSLAQCSVGGKVSARHCRPESKPSASAPAREAIVQTLALAAGKVAACSLHGRTSSMPEAWCAQSLLPGRSVPAKFLRQWHRGSQRMLSRMVPVNSTACWGTMPTMRRSWVKKPHSFTLWPNNATPCRSLHHRSGFCQVDQGRFTAAGTADNANGLARLSRKAPIGQAGRTSAVVGERITSSNATAGAAGSASSSAAAGSRHRGVRVQDLVHAHTAGQGTGTEMTRSARRSRLTRNLVPIIDERDDLALGPARHY